MIRSIIISNRKYMQFDDERKALSVSGGTQSGSEDILLENYWRQPSLVYYTMHLVGVDIFIIMLLIICAHNYTWKLLRKKLSWEFLSKYQTLRFKKEIELYSKKNNEFYWHDWYLLSINSRNLIINFNLIVFRKK